MINMTEEWVSFWYQCLSENMDYSAYCNARAEGQSQTCKDYEARFPKIETLYEDFGPLDGWPDGGIKSARWKAWFEPRRQLFIADVREVISPSEYQPDPSRLLLTIPLHSDEATTLSAVKSFFETYYRTHKVATDAQPKYRLNTKDGRVAHGYEKVRQACLTSYRSYTFDDDFEYRDVKDVICHFLKNEIDDLGWSMKDEVRQELMTHGTMNPDSYEIFRVRVNKCRREFSALSRGALNGRFPDDTYFESEVLDQFRGE